VTRCATDETKKFQSRSGFSPCLDLRQALGNFYMGMFQSRSGFSPCLDLAVRRQSDVAKRVSIPFWVFSLPRQVAGPAERSALVQRFNPVLGFLPASTPGDFAGDFVHHCFNPVLGFLPASTRPQKKGSGPDNWFQSRSGFSPCLDTAG